MSSAHGLYRHLGQSLPLIDFSRGIRNPAALSSTLSIVASANGPYDDVESDDAPTTTT